MRERAPKVSAGRSRQMSFTAAMLFFLLPLVAVSVRWMCVCPGSNRPNSCKLIQCTARQTASRFPVRLD